MSKLPFKMRDNWRMTVCDIQEAESRRASFKDLLHFMERKTRLVGQIYQWQWIKGLNLKCSKET